MRASREWGAWSWLCLSGSVWWQHMSSVHSSLSCRERLEVRRCSDEAASRSKPEKPGGNNRQNTIMRRIENLGQSENRAPYPSWMLRLRTWRVEVDPDAKLSANKGVAVTESLSEADCKREACPSPDPMSWGVRAFVVESGLDNRSSLDLASGTGSGGSLLPQWTSSHWFFIIIYFYLLKRQRDKDRLLPSEEPQKPVRSGSSQSQGPRPHSCGWQGLKG